MLKHLNFSGMHQNDGLSVSVTMENPADHGIGAANLLFSVTAKFKDNRDCALNIEDFAFYVMDESNSMHNTKRMFELGVGTTKLLCEEEHKFRFLVL